MSENSAGGYVFKIEDWARLDRFLILGTESPTYYVSQRKITSDNAECIIRCIKEDGIRTVKRIADISIAGRAPKNDPALFALSLAISMGDIPTKRLAATVLPDVARIGTHLFHWAEFVKQHRGWGRLLCNAVADWYQNQSCDNLAYQVVKYQQRDGWSHRDLLRLSHPKAGNSEQRAAIYNWVTHGTEKIDITEAPEIIQGFEAAKRAQTTKEIVKLIEKYNLPRESIPTEWLTDIPVWDALLQKMPMMAMVRNLATMTKVGLLKPMSSPVAKVVEKLHDTDQIKKSRIHPISVLAALKTYAQGHGKRGHSVWTPVPQIIDALDDAFYLAFDNVQPTGKRFYLGIDVSASMDWSDIAGIPGLTPRVAAAAMSMVTVKSEPEYYVGAFSHHMQQLTFSPKQRLDDICRITNGLNFGGTDCALPMIDALKKNIEADVFIIYTDCETWAGNIHPFQALQQYRRKMGINAKLIVVGMTATEFSIADPDDDGMLDVVGFDTAVPALMQEFIQND
jgi:60 kDa SS-A/Ro ribonucleoprotein